MIKKSIAVACFVTGLIGGGFAAVWYVMILITRRSMWPFPTDIVWIESLFALWASVMFATFFQSLRPIWAPLVAVTDKRVQTVKLLLGLALLHTFVLLVIVVSLWVRRAFAPLAWVFCLFAASCVLLNAIYVCIHWALRPEAIFSSKFRRFASDPIVFVVFHVLRKSKLIK